MPLILETGAGLANANAYADVTWGNEYHLYHLYASTWFDMVTTEKEAALVWATRLLDEQVEWAGWKTTQGQALRWPRSGVPDRESSASAYADSVLYGLYLEPGVIPVWLKNATAELARVLKESNRTADLSTVGYSQISVGSISLTIDKADKINVLPDSVMAMCRPYGTVMKSGGIGFAKLVRV